MDLSGNNGKAGAGGGRSFLPVSDGGGDSGYYERSSDVHLYDLMGDDLAGQDIDGVISGSPGDVLVASGAWAVPPEGTSAVEDWLKAVKEEPHAWLTPWREGEPSLEADLWLQSQAGPATTSGRFLVAKLENAYLPGVALRASLNGAADRFADLRRAIELSWSERLHSTLRSATREWLADLEAAAGSGDEDEGDPL